MVILIHRELIAEGQAGGRTKAKTVAPRRTTNATTRKRSIGNKGTGGSVSEAVSKEGFRNLLPKATKLERATPLKQPE